MEGIMTDTNIGSNGDGSSLEVPRTLDLWESRPVLYSLGNGVNLYTHDQTWNDFIGLDYKLKFSKDFDTNKLTFVENKQSETLTPTNHHP